MTPNANGSSVVRIGFAEIQRSRLISATLHVAAERGGPNVTVGAVVARAGVSRRTFYELFASSEQCLLAAVEHAFECARAYVCQTYDSGVPWSARVRSWLEGLLAFLDEEPAMGRLLIVESLRSGPDALAVRSAAIDSIAAEIDSAHARRHRSISPLIAEGVAGGVLAVLHARLLDTPREPLLELVSPLTAMVVLPYLGATAANRELSGPAPKRRRRDRALTGHAQLDKLPMRLTYSTMLVIAAVGAQPRASNRRIGQLAGIADQGQISKLLQRLARLGLVENAEGRERGAPNAWTLTPLGSELERATSAAIRGGLRPSLC
jgi:AcrR family transcriptional regulator